ncbi:MAG TPA: flagellar biosynthesis protein FlhF [Bdellovibrionota bacterium]|nr:flagellar biosynthesis protein FlhF [Bdellovibrionota bacterium]
MQVKKFEAPTIQEALDNIKRELGPEAIILQTKKNKRGFGLLSKASVEVTAAVSDRSIQKKNFVETRLPEPNKALVKKLPASRQAELFDKYTQKHMARAQTTRDRVELSTKGAGAAALARAGSAPKGLIKIEPSSIEETPITARRYIDITDEEKQIERQPLGMASAPSVSKRPASGATAGRLGATGAEGGMTVEEELRQLKRMLEEMKNAQDEGGSASGAQALLSQSALSSPLLQDGFDQLIINGVDKRYALALVKKASFEAGASGATNAGRAIAGRNPEEILDQVALELMESTEVISPLGGIEAENQQNGPAVIALVGPTGVGKTTTVAKMASEALLKRNLKVGLINLDSYKVAAFDQLGTYAKILNVPFRSVSTQEELKAALLDFQSLNLVLVDTTGRSQRDPGSLKDMQAMLSSVPNLRTHLVLSVITRDSELYDMATRFSIFRPQGLIMSKLDEATIFGSIYNVSQKVKLPLLYFTTGQRVPEDIEEASRERVASLILNL